eukprot:gene458-548_t
MPSVTDVGNDEAADSTSYKLGCSNININESNSYGGDGGGEVDPGFGDAYGGLYAQNPSTQTYEELCESYMDAYMASANQYLQETKLMQRINDWNRRITPALEEQNKRPNFDIQEYGTHIIEDLADIVKRKCNLDDEEELVEANLDKNVEITFGELMVGVKPYDVCRRFASCLQLANNGNIEIVSNREVNNLRFHLLTTKPRYDIDGMKMPTLAKAGVTEDDDTESRPTTTKKKPTPPTTKKKAAARAKPTKKSKEKEESESENEDSYSETDDDESESEDESDHKKKKKKKTTTKKNTAKKK